MRLHHAMTAAGTEAELDLYEGLIHNFPAHLPGAPESEQALQRLSAFLRLHLGY
jgi:acetyl esterase/lipase